MTLTQVVFRKKVVTAEQTVRKEILLSVHIKRADKKSPHYNKELFEPNGGVFSKTFSEISQNFIFVLFFVFLRRDIVLKESTT